MPIITIKGEFRDTIQTNFNGVQTSKIYVEQTGQKKRIELRVPSDLKIPFKKGDFVEIEAEQNEGRGNNGTYVTAHYLSGKLLTK